MASKIGVIGIVIFVAILFGAMANVTFNKAYVPPEPSKPIIGKVSQIALLQKSSQKQPVQVQQPAPVKAGEKRTVKMGEKNFAFYFPESGSDTITLKLGQPVRLEGMLDGPEKLVGCMKSVKTPWGLKVFKPGDTAFEFTPDRTGTIAFTCGMGMGVGVFNIVN